MASPVVRWYVLAVTCLIYTINIADRYVVSTVLEPIRIELHLSDKGYAIWARRIEPTLQRLLVTP